MIKYSSEPLQSTAFCDVLFPLTHLSVWNQRHKKISFHFGEAVWNRRWWIRKLKLIGVSAGTLDEARRENLISENSHEAVDDGRRQKCFFPFPSAWNSLLWSEKEAKHAFSHYSILPPTYKPPSHIRIDLFSMKKSQNSVVMLLTKSFQEISLHDETRLERQNSIMQFNLMTKRNWNFLFVTQQYVKAWFERRFTKKLEL